MRKLSFFILISALIIASFSACSSSRSGSYEPTNNRTMSFTDSVGRTVELPKKITRVAVTGQMAQIVLFALAPDMLVGVASKWDDAAKPFIDEKYLNLPVLGQLYGGKGEMNLESLLAAEPQVVIDVGEGKKDIAEDMDALTAQTGIPFVHISAGLSDYGAAYAMLGKLLGLENEAEELAAYCDGVYDRAVKISATAEDKVKMLYIVGEEGLGVIARDSYHSEVIDLFSDNLAVVEEPSSKGTGNEVDLEQLLAWNPELIIFGTDSLYASAADDPAWQSLSAVNSGNYFKVPQAPYSWMGFPPSVQRLLGLLWTAKLLCPEQVDYDLYEEVVKYFELFYHITLTREQFDSLTANALR